MENYSLITGASRGIGRAIALALAKEGRNLILTADKDRQGLSETLSLVKKTYRSDFGTVPASYMRCLTFLCDVSDSEMVDYLYEELSKEGCRVDALINNAGISCFELIQDMTDEEWHRVMGVNMDGAFYMCRRFVPDMIRAKKGSIINISSYWGMAGSSMESAYCASKGALNAFTLSLAKELKESHIRVNAIACEFINTQMNAFLSEEEAKEAAAQMPSGRIIEPSEIGEIAAELLKDDCSLTGKIINMEKEPWN